MPTYTYYCEYCNTKLELFFYIKDYTEHPKCNHCNTNKTHRLYADDILTQSTSVKKSDNELKTIGDLAQRNAERMSEDEKAALWQKHNSYKDDAFQKPLPTGMSRIKKPKKIKWPGSSGIKKRRKLNGQ